MHRIYDNLFCFRTIDKVSFQFLGDVEAAEVKMKCERILFVHAILEVYLGAAAAKTADKIIKDCDTSGKVLKGSQSKKERTSSKGKSPIVKKSSSENSPFNKGGRKRASAGATDQAKLKSSPSEKESITSGLQTSEENYDGDSDKETLESVAKRVPSMVSETSKDCSHRDDAVRPCKETAANNEPSSSSCGTEPSSSSRGPEPSSSSRGPEPSSSSRGPEPSSSSRGPEPSSSSRGPEPSSSSRGPEPSSSSRVRNLPPALVVRNLLLNALTISEA